MKKVFLLAIAVSSLFAHVYFSRGPVRNFSATYDEPVHLTAGVVAWKTGQIRYNGYHHPPLGEMWAAWPTIFTSAIVPTQDPVWIRQRWSPADQYQFADRFLYHNRVDADTLLIRARWMQVALSLIFILFVFIVAWRVAGLDAGVVALAFASFSPTLLAHGAIVSTDLMFATCFFAMFASFLFLDKKWGVVLTGVSLGLCAVSKYFFWGVLPIVAAIFCYEIVVNKKKILQFPVLIKAAVALAISAVIIVIVCRPDQLDMYWLGLKSLFSRAQAGRSSFLLGEHRTEGWLIYFPYLFLVKSTVAELAAVVAAIGVIFNRKFRLPSFLWIPPLIFFAMACVSKVQIGHRYILAVYPFLFVIVGVGLSKIEHTVTRYALMTVLLVAAFIPMARANPNYLSYFNSLVRKPGYEVATDSNVDWGQGLKMLTQSLSPEEKSKGIYLCFFGTADPHYYGIKYLNIASDALSGHTDDSADTSLAPMLFAISATNFQATYYADRNVFAWLRAYTPRVVADSILLYDFSLFPEARQKLNALRSAR